MRYLFLSIKPKPFLRTLMAGLMLMCMVYFIWRIPLWMIPVVTIGVHLCYLVLRFGLVVIKRSRAKTEVQVRQLFKSFVLHAPLRYTHWWSYDFNLNKESDEGQPSRAGTNDLHVFLRVTDAHGSEVVFTEYIGFDTRFPNECPYSAVTPEPNDVIVRVQRTDRLLRFLRKHLETELIALPIQSSDQGFA